jgi:hypothetical protein
MDAPESSKPREDDENFDNCASYISGFVDGLGPTPGGCPSPDATVGTLIRVYVAYMEKNPKWLDDYRFVGLLRAIREAYPCPTK